MGRLSNQVALITGAGSGVGLAIAQAFLAEGAKLVLAGRDAAKLEKAAQSLNAGDAVTIVPTDITDPAAVAKLVEQATAAYGKIDILVNNAGTNLKARTMRELTPESWQTLIRTNLDGAFYCIQAVLPQMIARKDGVIVNINSVSGKRAYPLAGAAYVASKFGLAGLGNCLAAEERENNIRVSNIFPGEIDTPILEVRPNPVTEEARKVILKPADVASAVLFVATLPPHVSVPELIIKPTAHVYS
ncbi:SDR family oxidoreductase [Tuwongella immobilis]|uniref:Oxidoreductase n=1 Tax=Tuwongella immobilis TaxID=692036 RepID=A0A6C2YN36_9BACT|nr:SDR family oxidoreductase [Tuwongella immobilis]VIP02787.1 short-chain dehydrogenase reductase sdr : Oxidoreductase, short-chain dehydrogenase/reductase family protein OS=Blastopirellula marina DSM 3645 GN=DSM3645_20227 PE=3 SV=1: adh_short [Tuwongella immobilis]VTS02449.1 short-chain dehydrogenase reductase sdr : Oxidoreductase, short-chain dehydrogenase/reductase family protein OS=Blastopirellula marina DSM 3645 GN=DSM3645_20227 PE=3 SV=1: adh_short [Tuwongella immobilis]